MSSISAYAVSAYGGHLKKYLVLCGLQNDFYFFSHFPVVSFLNLEFLVNFLYLVNISQLFFLYDCYMPFNIVLQSASLSMNCCQCAVSDWMI